MNYKKFVWAFLIIVLFVIICIGSTVAYIDPLFHCRKPRPEFFYSLKSQRYQNDGILRNFDYDAIITGTSMTENFKSTEFDFLFDVKSVKVPYMGGSFKEINDAIKVAYKSGHLVKSVIRGLDAYRFTDHKEAMRKDLGTYPVYLYNDDFFDDLKYFLNKDIFVKYCIPMLKNRIKGKDGGITTFDEYSNWNNKVEYGKEYVLQEKLLVNRATVQAILQEDEKSVIRDNIRCNVVDLAISHPETTFYYFFPPYSVVYWVELINKGKYLKYIEAEKLVIEIILECPNIKLFSFNDMEDITMNLDNYKDTTHYGEWINSDILVYMKENKGLLTKENYQDYLRRERELYMNYDYEKM